MRIENAKTKENQIDGKDRNNRRKYPSKSETIEVLKDQMTLSMRKRVIKQITIQSSLQRQKTNAKRNRYIQQAIQRTHMLNSTLTEKLYDSKWSPDVDLESM